MRLRTCVMLLPCWCREACCIWLVSERHTADTSELVMNNHIMCGIGVKKSSRANIWKPRCGIALQIAAFAKVRMVDRQGCLTQDFWNLNNAAMNFVAEELIKLIFLTHETVRAGAGAIDLSSKTRTATTTGFAWMATHTTRWVSCFRREKAESSRTLSPSSWHAAAAELTVPSFGGRLLPIISAHAVLLMSVSCDSTPASGQRFFRQHFVRS